MINKISRRPVFAAVTALCVVVVGLFAGAAPAQAASTSPTWISVWSGDAVGPEVLDIRARSLSDGANAQLWTRISGDAGNNQVWRIEPYTYPGTTRRGYVFHNINSGKCLDKRSSIPDADGNPVQQWSCNYQPQQLWYFLTVQKTGYGSAWGELWNASDGRCLDAAAPGDADGTPVQVWTCTGADNQRWNIS